MIIYRYSHRNQQQKDTIILILRSTCTEIYFRIYNLLYVTIYISAEHRIHTITEFWFSL